MERDWSKLLDATMPLVAAAVITAGILPQPGGEAWVLALALPAAFVLFLRHRTPTGTLAVSAAFALALFAVDHQAGVITAVAPAAALYSFALSRRRLHLIIATSAAVVAVAAADVFLAGGRALTLQTAMHVALVATPLLAAEALRNHRSYVRVLLERVELAERTREEEAQRRAEQERLRIARDVHDILAHTLTTINVQAGVARHLLDRDPGLATSALASIETASHDALDELRGMIGVLRTGDTETAPLEPPPGLAAVGVLLQQSRDSGTSVNLAIDGREPPQVPETVQLAAYRIVQESLTNARRHAPGQDVRMRLDYEPQGLRITIENERLTVPHADRAGDGRPGVGIIGMRERAAAVGGRLEAGTYNRDFRVLVELPYQRPA